VGGWSTPCPGRFTPGKDQVLIVWEAGWASELVCTGAENLASNGIRPPDRPTRSQSLYRLSYPGSYIENNSTLNCANTFNHSVLLFNAYVNKWNKIPHSMFKVPWRFTEHKISWASREWNNESSVAPLFIQSRTAHKSLTTAHKIPTHIINLLKTLKVKFSSSRSRRHIGGVDVYLQSFLNSAGTMW